MVNQQPRTSCEDVRADLAHLPCSRFQYCRSEAALLNMYLVSFFKSPVYVCEHKCES